MAEALAVLGLVSAIVQFVDFGSKVVNRLNEFKSDTDEVPKTFRSIKIQLPLMVDTLERTQKQAAAGGFNDTTANALKPVVYGCLEQVKRLERILDRNVPAETASSWQRRLLAIKSLAHDNDVHQIDSMLEHYIHLLTFHQATSNSELLIRETLQLSTGSLVNLPRKPVFMVPFHRDDMFVGRAEILNKIKLKLNKQQRRAVLAGIGGVGKSQIAIEYCYRYKDEQPEGQVFWVHSSNITRFDQAYRKIARKLKIPGFDDPAINTLEIVMEWLSDDSNGPWLMVLDNADDKEVLFGANAQASSPQSRQQESNSLFNYIPGSSNGSILVTTRDRRVGERFMNREKPVAVVAFEAADAKQLLRNRLPNDHEWDEAASMELLETLNFLPLAITQAAAYISEEEKSLVRYLDLLRPGEKEATLLLEQDYYDPGRDSTIQNSIFLTWQISFDQIRKQKPRAAEILSLMAVLDKQAVSDKLLQQEDERKVNFDTAIGTLKAFSLITEEKNQATFNIHRLVQLSTQKWLEHQQILAEWQEKALNAVFDNCPLSGKFEDWATWESINPHVQVVLDYVFKTEPCQLKRASILRRAASFNRQQGQYGAAYDKDIEAQTLYQELFGKEHPETLLSMNNLALTLGKQGKYTEAEKIHRQALELRKRVVGVEYPDTLLSMNNLACVVESQGKYAEAEKMHRQVLELREKVVGAEYLDTLTSMNNLACVLDRQCKYIEGEEIYRKTLKLSEEGLGKEHPNTLNIMHNLALVLDSQGKYAEAKKILREVLKLRKEVLGKEHPDTLLGMNNLASLLKSQGNYAEAEEMNRQVLSLNEKVLGKEHPKTLTSMNNLGSVLAKQGKYAEAEDLHRQVLKSREKALGKEHPEILISMNNRGTVLWNRGKYAEAEDIYRQILKLSENSIEKNGHPDTLRLTCKNNLASALLSQGEYAKAKEIHMEVLNFREKVLGKEHPDTLMSMNNLGSVLIKQGKYAEAEDLHRQVLKSREKALGKEHPDTLWSIDRLAASVLARQGKHAEAEELRRQLLMPRGERAGEGADTL